MPTYLALGDSMSIDDYTGVKGGGAASQFYKYLGAGWKLDDRTRDGCRMPGVPTNATGDLITLTVGGNDMLWNRELYLEQGVSLFTREHLRLLQAIRSRNPEAIFIVGDVYHPAAPLTDREEQALALANEQIRQNCEQVGARFAPIYETFLGREDEYLCLQIEPTLAGATAIARLFIAAYEQP